MSMEVDFSEPYLEESFEPAVPLQIPQFMEVSIAGRTYVMDTSFEPYRRDAFRHRSIQAQRESISLDNIPGVGTVNTEGLWRREAWDWHYGAGQPYQDRKESVDARFSTSKGVNPWMQWQLELLNDTKQVKAMSGNGQVLQVGQFIYLLDLNANTLSFTSDLVNWTTLLDPTNNPGVTMTMMATDGYNLWIGSNTSLILTTAGAPAAGAYVSDACEGVWYVGDRLMVSVGNSIYNILTTGALPTALWTHPNANFAFTAMAAGSSQIYIGGYVTAVGGPQPLQSIVYRTTIEATGTALTIPVQALPMEGGDYCPSLYGYLNYVFVGSNLGIRMCRTIAAYDPTGNEGDLEAGPLIPGLFPPGPVNSPVYAMTGNNRFVYFGWTDYDGESTGLGRCDLSTFIDTQAPAFASDLMVSGQGWITDMDWCTINSAPIFVVNGMGLYTASSAVVESGYVTSGYLNYDISDNKIAMAGGIGTVQPQAGTVTMNLATDSSNPANLFAFAGQQVSASEGGTPNQASFPVGAIRGQNYQIQMVLSRDTVTGASPVLNRWTLKVIPGVTAGTTISVVLRMWTTQDVQGQDDYDDPYQEKAFLENLRQTQTVFAYVEGPYTAPYCTVDEIDWLPEKARDANPAGGFEGNIIVYLKTWDLNG